MSLTAQEEAWRVLSESVFAEMASWRKEHPTATFAEIEEELDARLSGVRALMLQDLAQESQKRDWREQAKAERPRCPQCGRPEHSRGKQERRLLTQGGRQVKLERQYGSWEDVWQRLFSRLYEELALPPNGVTPLIYQGLVLLGAYMPFEAASKTLSTLLKAQLSSSTVWRLTEQAGKDLQTWQDEQAAPLCEPTEKGPVSEQLVIETDGVLVPLRPNEWAEVKMVSIGEPKAGKEEAVHCSQLSYFARLTDADTFADVASGEMGRRGVEQAKAVAAVQDGADWIQGFVQGHRADALRILDFPHAAEYVTAIAELANGAGVQLPEHWLSQELHTLKHEGPTHTLQEVQRLSALAPVEGMAEKVAYLSKREGQMQYPLYQAAGWPIGRRRSGKREQARGGSSLEGTGDALGSPPGQ